MIGILYSPHAHFVAITISLGIFDFFFPWTKFIEVPILTHFDPKTICSEGKKMKRKKK